MTRSHALIFLHHLLLAAVISSAALLFELTVLYKKLDFYTLYWMGSSKHEADMDPDAQRLRARQSVVDNKNKPRVLLINDLVWKDFFRQQRDPSKMAELIEKILEKKPRVLAVAMDLSPSSFDSFDPQGIHEQLQLDTLLDRAAKRGQKIVLDFKPSGLGDPEIAQKQLEWMWAHCDAGVQFALTPQPLPSGTPMVGYDPQFPSLGLVAYKLATEVAQSNAPSALSLCSLRNTVGSGSHAFHKEVRRLDRMVSDFEGATLNIEFFADDQNVDHIELVPTPEVLPSPKVEMPPALTGQVVFLGEDIRSDSKVVTTSAGVFSQVFVKAAVFYSQMQKFDRVGPGRAYVSDVVFGVVLGYLFSYVWGKYNEAAERLRVTPLTPLAEKVQAYFSARSLLLLCIGLLPLIMYGMLRSSGFLFNLHLWLNPLPVVIGMFIDGLLHSRREKHHDPASIRELVNGHPDIVLQVVFVTGVLVYVFAFAHTDVVS